MANNEISKAEPSDVRRSSSDVKRSSLDCHSGQSPTEDWAFCIVISIAPLRMLGRVRAVSLSGIATRC